ncbi:flagellar M-ring protein FliF [Sphingomonas sp. MAH-20]|uniref:Flagellar M-ring protein n=1 Tax=Sphingomonas horti TaxID=2682842 RepID=A0A6I4J2S8_9SPHN|nr:MULTISPECIES: flagellar basal-body MS-ring/collar protein FliF [Sphingomonas]MBA2918969.1 flagellar M-ring protein FliF [Sphingomonas sp. CGMCC 1.13658]MVO79002.1 flagellar M-ring protein FliF [Sphingomonas horti]
MASNALTPASQGEVLPAAPAGAALGDAGRNPMGALQRVWAQPAVKKSAPLIGLLGLLGSAALAWTLVATPPQKILFSGLSDADKASASEALSQAKIDSHIDPQTGTLTVAADDYYKARMLLASQNLPKATPGGYAILDQLPMGVSRAVEGERLRQARETELAKSIEEIEGVTEARVHLAMPENTVFVRDNAAPSASVIVRLAANQSLSEAQVRSIVNLVASSVPGMKPDAVTIVDGAGSLLTKPGGAGASGVNDERIDFQRRVENKYREQLTQLLTPLVGAGNFSAEVQAEVNLDESQATREAYGKEGALRAEQGNWTGNQAGPVGAEGIPGTLSNTPPPAAQVKAGQAAAPAGAATPVPGGKVPDQLKQSDQFSRAYELDKEISVTRAVPGSIKRLSVAVVLRDPETGKPRNPQEIAQITDLVRAAVGYDAARNDQVTVISRKFAGASEEEAKSPWYDAGWFPVVARNLTALVIALLVLFVGLKPMLKMMGRKREEGGSDLGEFAMTRPQGVSVEALENAQDYEDKVKLVRDFTRDNPARAALAVKDMIRSDGKAAA